MNEKQLMVSHNETQALDLKFEQQKKKAYNKIFKDYIPIFKSDPADLISNFLAF